MLACTRVHLLIGHHGLFSLTPVFLLSLAGDRASAGCQTWCAAGRRRGRQRRHAQVLYPLTPSLDVWSLLLLHLHAPAHLRRRHLRPGWLMWLTPFLLLSLLPAADCLADKPWGRRLAYVCLGISMVSAVYPMQNPWKHPWLYNFMDSQGWLPY